MRIGGPSPPFVFDAVMSRWMPNQRDRAKQAKQTSASSEAQAPFLFHFFLLLTRGLSRKEKSFSLSSLSFVPSCFSISSRGNTSSFSTADRPDYANSRLGYPHAHCMLLVILPSIRATTAKFPSLWPNVDNYSLPLIELPCASFPSLWAPLGKVALCSIPSLYSSSFPVINWPFLWALLSLYRAVLQARLSVTKLASLSTSQLSRYLRRGGVDPPSRTSLPFCPLPSRVS
ncbi:hypothetical protein F4819DRAFT_98219 [Hypoxylon fuscum]|nr:hypothetical protein F4819DRAFT_98219 [Hypoxylon fuscum]